MTFASISTLCFVNQPRGPNVCTRNRHKKNCHVRGDGWSGRCMQPLQLGFRDLMDSCLYIWLFVVSLFVQAKLRLGGFFMDLPHAPPIPLQAITSPTLFPISYAKLVLNTHTHTRRQPHSYRTLAANLRYEFDAIGLQYSNSRKKKGFRPPTLRVEGVAV